MAVLRKVALGLVLAALAAILLLAALELWNYRQWASLPLREPGLNEDNRALILQDRMDLLTKRVGDMELLVLILLGTSSVYAIVIVMSSYLSATSFARQANQTISHMQDQIGLAMGDLRELQERTEQTVEGRLAVGVTGFSQPVPTAPTDYDRQIAGISARLQVWLGAQLSEESKLDLLRDESTAARLDAVAGAELSAPLAALYLDFSRLYAGPDPARSRFHLERAQRLAPPPSPLASEIHYELACRFASSHEFTRAITELAAAFQHQFRALEERLAGDIEEGGQLYELASTPPFDKAVNDLLLTMSIGIG
jgi:hypothetical protein